MSGRRRLQPAQIFAALGDPQRLRLVRRLSEGGAHSIGALAEGAGITRQAVARHLGLLEGAGLVRGVRDGREHLWVLDETGLVAGRRELIMIARAWRTRRQRRIET